MFGTLVLLFFFGGPGGVREVREVNRKNALLFSSKSDLLVPSYDQKTKKITDY